MYVIGARDVERLCAWKTQREVRLTYAESRRLRRVRKRNTFLFDALTDIAGYPYHTSEAVLEDMLYEAIMVDFRMKGHVRCLQPDDGNKPCILPAAELEKTLYEYGFYVAREDGSEVHFVPFVASASMSREEEYLFVNADRLDALLRAASLDMVAAPQMRPVLDGKPVMADEASPFEGLDPQAKVASVPKLAAYLGLALSDGSSLREMCAAGQEADESAWLLGMNEHNTVCVADWSDAPMKLETFQHCWVNEEAPLAPGRIPSKNVGERQTALQKRLQALFMALAGTDRAAFDALTAQADIWTLWQEGIGKFFAQEMDVELSEGGIPHLYDTAQGTSVYVAAAIYAACLHAEEGEFLLAKEVCAGGGLEVLTQADLTALAGRLATEEKLRNRLWNMMHEQDPATCRLLKATTEKDGVHLTLRRAPCTVFRAALRHIGWKSRHDRGNFYDGCGFMDDELFDRLEELLTGGPRPEGQDPLNAVQVRLPWCKGLLVRFTASEYFRAFAKEEGADVAGLTIADIFGRQRPLFDENGNALVKAFFTGSMFKGAGWFRCLQEKAEHQGEADRWAEYWRRLRAHRASLLIAGKSTQPGMTSRLNYQFLSTLGLNQEELHTLVERRLRQLGEALANQPIHREGMPDLDGSYRMAELLMGLSRPDEEELPDLTMDDDELYGGEDAAPVEDADGDEDPDEAADDEEDYLTLLGRAMVQHPQALRSTTLVMDRFDKLVRSEVQQMMRGRLSVGGDVRYLLPDLLQMVRYMAQKFLFMPDGQPLCKRKKLRMDRVRSGGKHRSRKPLAQQTAASPINDLSGDHPYGCYYAPGKRVPWTYRTGRLGQAGGLMDVAILRNPHYAQGEEPILSPLPEAQRSEYDRWFSQLTGCVMAPSAVMYTINGADCDGDRVNVCAEPAVLRAIRRRARRESGLMAAVITRQGEIMSWLAAQEAACGNKTVREYLLLLMRELPCILPPCRGVRPGVRSWYPPLIYTGSAAKGHVFSPADLTGAHLQEKLWAAFQVSRKQRIGQMSLHVLALTPDAYGDIPADAEKDMTPPQLLAHFLSRYLVVSSALDTAMEIDMAKTGAQRENHPLKSVPVELRKQLGLRRSSGFAAWRGLHGDYQQQLNGYGFSGAMERMMRDFATEWQPPENGAMGLDLLPTLVYHLFSPEKAAALFGAPAKAKEGKRTILRESMMTPDGRVPVSQVLRMPPQEDIDMLQQPLRGGASILEELAALLIRYDRERRLTARAQQASQGIDAAGSAVMRWLLTNGFGLDDALCGMDCLHAMMARWHACRPAGGKRVCDVFTRLETLAKDQSAAVRWGWTGDAALRAAQLDQMLHTAHGVQGELPPEMGFTAEEKALLTCSRRSIVLVRLVAEYGWRDALMQERSALGCAPTAEALESAMRTVIAREHPGRVNALFFAACRMLRELSYRDESGRYRALMSDFLLTYLLRKLLGDAIVLPAAITNEGGEARA